MASQIYTACPQLLILVKDITYNWWLWTGGTIIWGVNDVQELLSRLREKGWMLASVADAIGLPANTVRKWSAGGVTTRYPANAPLAKAALEQLLDRKRIPKKRRYTKKTPPAPES